MVVPALLALLVGCDGPGREKVIPLRQLAQERPLEPGPNSEFHWNFDGVGTFRTIAPTKFAMEIMGKEGWERCVEFLDDGANHGMCLARKGCLELHVQNNGVTRLQLYTFGSCGEGVHRSYHMNTWPEEGPPPDFPAGLFCADARMEGRLGYVCFESEAMLESRLPNADVLRGGQ
ncbi:MAG: hypothetical protein R3F61_02595 [Myxococcota bacterium]